jgi:hypothetical protein
MRQSTRGRDGAPLFAFFEAFSAAKDPARPYLNEDRLVAYGQRTFAVIDGVTDKSGARLDGFTGGWHAGHALEGALRELDDEGVLAHGSTEAVVARLNAAIAARYERFGLAAVAERDPNRRFAAAAAIAHVDGGALRLLVVGDCGARVDGARVVHRPHAVDDVMARLRASVFASLGEEDADASSSRRLEVARAYVVQGIATPPLPDDPALGAAHGRIAARAWSDLLAAFPEIERGLLRSLADGGIRGAARLRNAAGPLAHGVLDGFPTSLDHVEDLRLDGGALATLELFSDGYFGWPRTCGRVADWEAHFAMVERVDPHRINRFASTKGSSPGRFADDRSVLILRREPTDHEAA